MYNNGALSVSGHATVNLLAFSTGDYAGLAIFQARTDTNAVTVSGNANLNLNGSLLYNVNVNSRFARSAWLARRSRILVNRCVICTVPTRQGMHSPHDSSMQNFV